MTGSVMSLYILVGEMLDDRMRVPSFPCPQKVWIVREIVCTGRAIEQVRLDPKGYKPTNKPRLNSLAPVCCQEGASRHGEGGDMALVIRSCEERKGVQSKRLYS